MFLGDGMSFSTIAATRMYLGGEEKKLSFEEFEYAGFSKVRYFYSYHGQTWVDVS